MVNEKKFQVEYVLKKTKSQNLYTKQKKYKNNADI